MCGSAPTTTVGDVTTTTTARKLHDKDGKGDVTDAKIDAAMTQASTLKGDARYQAWADIDKMITAQAPAIPFLWDKTTLLHAPNVSSVPNPYIALWDLSFMAITP